MMKTIAFYSVCLLSVFNNGFASTSDLPKSLKDSIATAIKFNPKTVSTNELLEAIRFQTLAAKSDLYLPRGSVSCGKSQSNANYNYGTSIFLDKNSSEDCRLSVSKTIFDSGASYNRYKSQEAQEAATRAAFNTSDSMIPNTRGGLANRAMDNYVILINSQETIKYLNITLSLLQRFKAVEDDYLLTSAITEIELDITQLRDSMKLQKEAFEYTVTLPPAEKLEDLDETISSLKIPASAEDAILLALENGPEVIRRNLNVKMAEFDLKATKGSLGPYISVSASTGRGISKSSNDPTSNYRGTNNSVGIYLTIPLDASGHYQVKSAETNLSAKKSEREAAISDAKYAISEKYKRLINLRNNYISETKNYTDQLKYIESLAEEAETQQILGRDVTKILSSVATLGRRFEQLQRTKNGILYNLFSIQQVTGQLFKDFVD